MGYTKDVIAENVKQNDLAYPDPSRIDHNMIKLIAAELLIAKTELKVGIIFSNLVFLKCISNLPEVLFLHQQHLTICSFICCYTVSSQATHDAI